MARLEAEGIGFLGEGHDVLVALRIADDDAGPRILDLETHEMLGDDMLVADHHTAPVRNQIGPIGAARRTDAGGDDLEVLSPVRIGLE